MKCKQTLIDLATNTCVTSPSKAFPLSNQSTKKPQIKMQFCSRQDLLKGAFGGTSQASPYTPKWDPLTTLSTQETSYMKLGLSQQTMKKQRVWGKQQHPQQSHRKGTSLLQWTECFPIWALLETQQSVQNFLEQLWLLVKLWALVVENVKAFWV